MRRFLVFFYSIYGSTASSHGPTAQNLTSPHSLIYIAVSTIKYHERIERIERIYESFMIPIDLITGVTPNPSSMLAE